MRLIQQIEQMHEARGHKWDREAAMKWTSYAVSMGWVKTYVQTLAMIDHWGVGGPIAPNWDSWVSGMRAKVAEHERSEKADVAPQQAKARSPSGQRKKSEGTAERPTGGVA